VDEEDPIYIFDSSFGEHSEGLLTDYEVPKYFTDDYFSVMGDERPEFKWFLLGPPRSGSIFHQVCCVFVIVFLIFFLGS